MHFKMACLLYVGCSRKLDPIAGLCNSLVLTGVPAKLRGQQSSSSLFVLALLICAKIFHLGDVCFACLFRKWIITFIPSYFAVNLAPFCSLLFLLSVPIAKVNKLLFYLKSKLFVT